MNAPDGNNNVQGEIQYLPATAIIGEDDLSLTLETLLEDDSAETFPIMVQIEEQTLSIHSPFR